MVNTQRKQKSGRLQTSRLILKPFEERDREAVVQIAFDEEIKKTYMIPDFTHRSQAEKLFEKMLAFSRSDDHFEYGIYLQDRLIGFVNDCEIRGDAIELGYVIIPECKGQGFATEAVRACIGELFRMGYRQVMAGYFQENEASGRVMRKCGMHKLEAEEDIEYKGQCHHCLYYGIENPMI